MDFFTDKIDNIINTITNVDYTASSTSASFIAPKEKLQCFTTIGQDELNKLITVPVPTKLLKELLPVAEELLLNIINSSLSLGHIRGVAIISKVGGTECLVLYLFFFS